MRAPWGKRDYVRFAAKLFIVCAAILLASSVVSIFISPTKVPVAALLCLAFPLFFFVNLLGLLFAVFLRRKWWMLPASTFILSFPALCSYCPIRIISPTATPASDTLRIVSFNTRNFGGHESDSLGNNYVAKLMREAEADIVCFQEGVKERDFYKQSVIPLLTQRYPYYDILIQGTKSPMGLFSRFPILSQEIVTQSGNNHAIAYRVLRSAGDTLCIVNCHLSSIGLNEAQKNVYDYAFRGYVASTNSIGGLQSIVNSFLQAASQRALMADTLAAYIQKHRHESLIVCGDFNDTPVSYAVRRTASGLTDCYRKAGYGIGRTFCRNNIIVRIDHIFCSPDWEPTLCRVLPVETYSDHYPIIAKLIRKKP